MWLFMAVTLSNVFKGLLRHQMIDQQKWWFGSIEEVNDAQLDYLIYVPLNLITHYSIKERSIYDPNFKKLMKKIDLISLEDIFSMKVVEQFYRGKCSGFATSFNWDNLKILGGKQLIFDEILYEHVLDLRFIRKDFHYSHQIIQL